MAEARKFRLRCTFVKAGRLCQLSHLEVARALEYAVRRSGLPFAVSEGFSPHMKIAFGSALPVGVGSTCEIFDLTLKEYVPPARALEALCVSSAADLMVQSAAYIENAAPAASVAYPKSTYRARFARKPQGGEGGADAGEEYTYSEGGSVPVEGHKPEESASDAGAQTPPCEEVEGVRAIEDALFGLVVPETIERTRKGKTKVLEVDNFLPDMPEVEGDAIYFDLIARKDGSLRPDVFLRGCLDASVAADPTFPKLQIVEVTRIAQS